MKDFVHADLAKKEQSAFHKQILADSMTLVESSRRVMSANWPIWDRNDNTFRCKRTRDSQDEAAASRKEPEKMVLPLTYAQLQTFIAFTYSLLTQRESLFELSGFTPADEKPAQVGEALLNRDLAYNKINLVLLQYLLDIGRFGLGVLKNTWVTKHRMTEVTKTIDPSMAQGMLLTEPFSVTTMEDVVEYQGNVIVNVSPYRFYPDPSVPITKFQDGSFCGSEETYSVEILKQWEYDGAVAGVDHIVPCQPAYANSHGFTFMEASSEAVINKGVAFRGDGQVKLPVIITELQRMIIPKQYMVDDKPIGNEDYPVKYVILIANGSRVIKCEPMGYDHNQFTYAVTPFTYDNHSGCSTFALSDITDALQEVITWFINARVTNVTKIISDKLVVDTAAVNMQDIQNRSPIIRLTAAASGGIDRHIQQLKLQDVTQAHIGDVKFLTEIMQLVTGISDTIQGIMQPGRKSASQVNKAVASAATRLKIIADIAWSTGVSPLGEQMLSNLRQGLDTETYVKLMGQAAIETPEFLPVTATDLRGRYQFVVYDGTQPSDRYHTAQALEELVAMCVSNPQAAIMLGLDVRKLLMESLRLRNIRNAQRFLMDPVQQQQQLLLSNGLSTTGGTGSSSTNSSVPSAPTTGGNAGIDVQSILSSLGTTVGA